VKNAALEFFEVIAGRREVNRFSTAAFGMPSPAGNINDQSIRGYDEMPAVGPIRLPAFLL
jgi:hypothetical protein